MKTSYFIILCVFFSCKSKKTNLFFNPINNEISYQNKAFMKPLEIEKTDTFIYTNTIEKKGKKKLKNIQIENDTFRKRKFDGHIPLGIGTLFSSAGVAAVAGMSTISFIAVVFLGGIAILGGIASIYFLIKGFRKIRKHPENYKYKFWSYLLFIGTALSPFILLGLVLLLEYAYK